MMPLLKYISLILLITACSHQGMKKTIDANVDSQLVEIPPQAAIDFKKAIELVNEDKLDAALDAFLLMTKNYPQLAGPYANIGVIHSRNKKFEKAEAFLLIAKDKNKTNHKVMNQLALTYRHQGKFDLAKAEYELAINQSPTTADYYLNLGILYDLYMGDLNNAKVYYEKYQSLQSEDDRNVAGWIVDINRRTPNTVQVAGDGQ